MEVWNKITRGFKAVCVPCGVRGPPVTARDAFGRRALGEDEKTGSRLRWEQDNPRGTAEGMKERGDYGGGSVIVGMRYGGEERAVDASATRDRTASRGDAQSRPLQSSADIRAITLSTVLKILVRARAVLVGTR